MSGDTAMDDAEVSDGASDNDYSDQEHEPYSVPRKDDDNDDMSQTSNKVRAENGLEEIKGSNVVTKKPKLDQKDPLRPRRKKARRACHACQRAHLTCGDERPCERCKKRGIADACRDGVRKKAKYLHDAPPEALGPVLGPGYDNVSNTAPNHGPPTNIPSNHSISITTSTTTTISQPVTSSAGLDSAPFTGFFSQPDPSPTYSIFSAPPNSMPPPMPSRLSYGSQQSPLSPSFQGQLSRQNSLQSLPLQMSNDSQPPYDAAIFDPNNPTLFNFDLEGADFGNRYGAWEFGMLGRMSSGAVDMPRNDMHASMSSQGMGDVSNFNGDIFGNHMNQFGSIYPPEVLGNNPIFPVHQGLPHAYAIGTGPSSHHSPSTEASPGPSGPYDASPTAGSYNPNVIAHPPTTSRLAQMSSAGKFGRDSSLKKRSRDPSSIYEMVKEPYEYTTAFHRLTAYFQRRFNSNMTVRIAKSLASIRPSFISCTKSLARQDLVMMEQCLQRSLYEYEEEIMPNCCTPSIVCRRTGEIAAVNTEFTLMTGWTKEVLLGLEPNLNVNQGRPANDVGGNTARIGLTTPILLPASLSGQQGKASSKPQAIFLPELLDDDSVLEFYQNFAKLAFGDSRGSVTTRCKVLKYLTKEDIAMSPEQRHAVVVQQKSSKQTNPAGIGGMGNRVREIDGEHGIGRLERDGKMDCTYCWTVRTDFLTIPMLLVMNFLP